MKTFIGIMCLIVLSTCMAWHGYTNPDKVVYTAKRKLFMVAVSVEIAIMLIAIIISMRS